MLNRLFSVHTWSLYVLVYEYSCSTSTILHETIQKKFSTFGAFTGIEFSSSHEIEVIKKMSPTHKVKKEKAPAKKMYSAWKSNSPDGKFLENLITTGEITRGATAAQVMRNHARLSNYRPGSIRTFMRRVRDDNGDNIREPGKKLYHVFPPENVLIY